VFTICLSVWNKLAGSMGGMIETITAQYSLTTFFLIFYSSAYWCWFGNDTVPFNEKLMHGVK
jgi:POT family proton-dependent oligopeptide transporter